MNVLEAMKEELETTRTDIAELEAKLDDRVRHADKLELAIDALCPSNVTPKRAVRGPDAPKARKARGPANEATKAKMAMAQAAWRNAKAECEARGDMWDLAAWKASQQQAAE